MIKQLALTFLLCLLPFSGQAGGSLSFDSANSEYYSTTTVPAGIDDSDFHMMCLQKDTGTANFVAYYSFGLYYSASSAVSWANIGSFYAVSGGLRTWRATVVNDSNVDASMNIASVVDPQGWSYVSLRTLPASREVRRAAWNTVSGVALASDSTSWTASLLSSNFDGIRMGITGDSTPSNPMEGEVSWCALWNDDAQFGDTTERLYAIQAGMSPDIAAPTGLVGYWRFWDDSATAQDLSNEDNDMTRCGGCTISETNDSPKPTYWPRGGM